MTAVRPGLPPLPDRMRGLPVEERGYPVPWFVDWVDGKPDFRVMDGAKFRDAIRFKKCWVCGGPLGRYATFVAGPMCGINRTSAEPPAHLVCAEWSAQACPFLTRPSARRREVGMPDVVPMAGMAILRNPGVTMLWTTRDYSLFGDGKGGMLFRMGEPSEVFWFREGRPATRGEVETSIEEGLPALRSMAETQPGALAELERFITRLKPRLPAP